MERRVSGAGRGEEGAGRPGAAAAGGPGRQAGAGLAPSAPEGARFSASAFLLALLPGLRRGFLLPQGGLQAAWHSGSLFQCPENRALLPGRGSGDAAPRSLPSWEWTCAAGRPGPLCGPPAERLPASGWKEGEANTSVLSCLPPKSLSTPNSWGGGCRTQGSGRELASSWMRWALSPSSGPLLGKP